VLGLALAVLLAAMFLLGALAVMTSACDPPTPIMPAV